MDLLLNILPPAGRRWESASVATYDEADWKVAARDWTLMCIYCMSFPTDTPGELVVDVPGYAPAMVYRSGYAMLAKDVSCAKPKDYRNTALSMIL